MNVAAIAEPDWNPLESVPFFVGALVVLAVTLLLLRPMARLVRSIAPIDEESRVSWGLTHVLLLVLVFVASMVVVPALVPLPQEGAWLLVLSSLSMVPPCALAAIIAFERDPTRLRALGFRAGSFFRVQAAGVAGYAFAVPCLIAVVVVWRWILARCGIPDAEQDVIKMLKDLQGGDRLLAVAFGVVVQPFLEEFLFRGFLQPYLVQRLRAVAGIGLTSALFASLHGTAPFAPIFALSCLLGYVMMTTHRLHAVWIVHAVHNGFQFLFLYALPETFQHAPHSGGLVAHFLR